MSHDDRTRRTKSKTTKSKTTKSNTNEADSNLLTPLQLFVQAMSIGQGAMATVHGGSAKDGIERLAELIAYHHGVELRMARWQVYRSVDLVVHVTGNNRTGRYVTEIVAPSVEEDGARFIMHRLLAASADALDARARPASEPQRAMLERLLATDTGFTTDWWHRAGDTHRPLRPGRERPLVGV